MASTRILDVSADPLLVVIAIGAGVVSGLLAHEGLHAAVLRLAGVEYDVEFAVGLRARSVTRTDRPWAAVRPVRPVQTAPGILRIAALAPLLLLVPAWLALHVETQAPAFVDLLLTGAALGWLACALPSPNDFSVAFYAHRLVDGSTADGRPDDGSSAEHVPR